MSKSTTQPNVQGRCDDAVTVPPGYKRTEVGVIPEDWGVAPFGEFVQIVMGQSPSGSTYNSNGLGIPLINGPTEFTGKHPIKIQWTTEPTRFCEMSDVLLCVRGSSTGRINIADDSYCIGRGIAAVRATARSVDALIPYFVAEAVGKLLSLSTGSTFPSIDKKAIGSIPTPLPSVAEQHAIAAALTDVDSLIGALDKLIAKKRAIKQAAMQQLLTGKTRLPGFTGEWQTRRFEEIATLRNEKKNPRATEADTVCVELEHIGQGDGRLLDHTVASKVSSIKYSFRTGDTLFGRLRSYLRKYWYADRDGLCTTEMWPLVAQASVLASAYLYYIVQTDRFIDAARTAYGTHMPRADWAVIKNFEILMPTAVTEAVKEQQAIAVVLSDMDAEIAALESRRDKTQAIKQGMMQELLTGRVRLVKPEAET